MKRYDAYIPWETHRFTRTRNFVILVVLLAVLMAIVTPGINKYLGLEEKVAKFHQYQEKQFKTTPDYQVYSIFGITIMFMPAPIAILFDYTIVPPDLTSKVNMVTTLEINSNMKGKILARGFYIGPLNFGFLLLTVVSLLIMLAAYETLHSHEYQKFLSSFNLNRKAVFTTGITRFFLCIAGILAVVGGVLLYIKIRGVSFTAADYKGLLVYLTVTLAVFLFFFTLGLIFSFIRSLTVSLALLFGTWLFFAIIIPAGFYSMIDTKIPDAVKDLETALTKLEIQMDFEERAKKEQGKFDRNKLEAFTALAESYWTDDFPRIVKAEQELKKELEKAAADIEDLFILTPGTFYLMTCSEVSSTGYRSFFEFYRDVLEMMIKFSRFWLDRVFHDDVKKMVNFIKGDEDVFRSQSRVPRHYLKGLLLHYGICLVLAALVYFFLLRSLFPRTKEPQAFDNIKIDLKSGKSYLFGSFYPDFNAQFFNRLFGKDRGLKWNISLDGRDITEKAREGTRYLPDPNRLPEEIKGRQLLNLIKRLYKVPEAEVRRIEADLGEKVLKRRFKELAIEEKVRVIVMITALTRGSLIIIGDLIDGIPPKKPVYPGESENKEKKDEDNEGDILYIQEMLRDEKVVLIDISKRRNCIDPDCFINIKKRKGKYSV